MTEKEFQAKLVMLGYKIQPTTFAVNQKILKHKTLKKVHMYGVTTLYSNCHYLNKTELHLILEDLVK